jgi:uncharacterized membrane protein
MALKDHVRWLLPVSLLINAFAAGAVVVQKAFDAQAAALEASDQKLRQASGQIKQALDAPQLDQEALKTGLSGLRDALDAHGAAIAAAIVEAAGSLSPEGRKHLAARTPPDGGPPDGPPPPR